MNLEEKVKKYSQIENLIKLKQVELQKLRDNKSLLTQSILADYQRFNLSEKSIPNENFKLRAYQYKQSTPLSFTFLKSCLHDIIPKDTQVEQIINYVKSKRSNKVINDLKKIN